MRDRSELQSNKTLWSGQAAQLAGSIFYGGVMWVAALYMIRFAGLQAYGQFSAAMAVAAPIFMMTNARGRLMITSDAPHGCSTSAYVAFRMLSSLLGFLLVVAFSWWWQGNSLTVVVCVALFKAGEAVSDIIFGGYQRAGKPYLVGIAQLIRSFFFALCLLVSHQANINSIEHLLLLICVALFSLTVLDGWFLLSRVESDQLSLSKSEIGRVCLLLKPFIAVAFLASLFTVLPRLFLEAFHGYEAVGIYSALMLFNNAALLVAAALGQPYVRDIVQLLTIGEKQVLFRLAAIPFLIALPLGLLFLLGSNLVSELIFDNEISIPHAYWLLVLGVVLANGFALFQWYILAAFNVRREQIWLAALSLCIGIFLCLVLIPIFGIIGALSAELIGLLAQCILGAVIILRCLKNYGRALEA